MHDFTYTSSAGYLWQQTQVAPRVDVALRHGDGREIVEQILRAVTDQMEQCGFDQTLQANTVELDAVKFHQLQHEMLRPHDACAQSCMGYLASVLPRYTFRISGHRTSCCTVYRDDQPSRVWETDDGYPIRICNWKAPCYISDADLAREYPEETKVANVDRIRQ